MTLTLDEVNRIRFPMARRPNEGYRAGEVDDFVDNVVATFTALHAEADRLKAQIEALKSDQGHGASQDTASHNAEAQEAAAQTATLAEENERLRREVEQLRNRPEGVEGTPTGDTGELEALRQRNAELQQRLSEVDDELTQLRQQPPAQLAGEGEVRVEKVVVTTSAEASSSAIRLVSLATEQAERVITDADVEAAEKLAAAQKAAGETTNAAQAKAEEIRATAQGEADRLLAEARAHAEQAEVDARARREELITNLEAERDEFASKIDQLKSWESSYRSRIADYLRGQVEAVESGHFSPDDAPSLLGDERNTSATPRLDALLADRQ